MWRCVIGGDSVIGDFSVIDEGSVVGGDSVIGGGGVVGCGVMMVSGGQVEPFALKVTSARCTQLEVKGRGKGKY